MEIISQIFSELWSVWKEMWGVIWDFIPKAFFFTLWVITGILILPCVFVAGHIFPLWNEWGEGF